MFSLMRVIDLASRQINTKTKQKKWVSGQTCADPTATEPAVSEETLAPAADERRTTDETTAGGECYLEGTKVSFKSLEFKSSCVNVCIIDDCKDADVPLLEMQMQGLHLKHDLNAVGKASSTIRSGHQHIFLCYLALKNNMIASRADGYFEMARRARKNWRTLFIKIVILKYHLRPLFKLQ